jgi:SAM-dependent methyltransferase
LISLQNTDNSVVEHADHSPSGGRDEVQSAICGWHKLNQAVTTITELIRQVIIDMSPDNKAIYDANWHSWLDMKLHGPASRWLRFLIRSQINRIQNRDRIESILDVGCGEGTITHALAEWLPHARVVGIDFSAQGIHYAASRYKRPNLEFIHDEDSHQLQRRYDLVTAFEVLEHIDKWNDFLDRIANSARRFILLSFPTGNMRPFEKAMGHYRNFKPEEVEQLMLERDFRPISLLYAGFPFYSPLYRDFCNLTQPQISSFVTGTYGLTKRMVSILVYCSFRFCSTRRRFGDQFCGLFSRISENLEPSES